MDGSRPGRAVHRSSVGAYHRTHHLSTFAGRSSGPPGAPDESELVPSRRPSRAGSPPDRRARRLTVGVLVVVAVVIALAWWASGAVPRPPLGPASPGSTGSNTPPTGFLPDQSIVANGSVIDLGPQSMMVYNVYLPEDADVIGSFAASSAVTACLVNSTATAPFGSSPSEYAPIPPVGSWSNANCEWASGPVTTNSSFDAYVIGGNTTLVFTNNSPDFSSTFTVTTEIYATFDEY